MPERLLPWMFLTSIGLAGLLLLEIEVSAIVGLSMLLPMAFGIFMGVMFSMFVVGLGIEALNKRSIWSGTGRLSSPLTNADIS